MSKINESIYSRCSFINLKINLILNHSLFFFYLDIQRDQQISSHTKKRKEKNDFHFFQLLTACVIEIAYEFYCT
jgi:hypothetical protein